MAFITVTCPVCGGQAQIEAGRSVMCPYCANELGTAPTETDLQFAQQDMQFAQDVQFAPPPAQQMPMQQPAAMPMTQMQQAQYPAQMQYTPAQLAEAQKKRKNWYMTNTGLIAVQTLVMAVGCALASGGSGRGVAMILSWVLSLPICAILSALWRPDDAYIDKKPFVKSKIAQGFLHFLLSAASSAAAGGILCAILIALFS